MFVVSVVSFNLTDIHLLSCIFRSTRSGMKNRQAPLYSLELYSHNYTLFDEPHYNYNVVSTG